MAVEHGVYVIRADVARHTENLLAYGSSSIIDSHGVVLQSARQLGSELIVADIDTTSHLGQRGNTLSHTDETRRTHA